MSRRGLAFFAVIAIGIASFAGPVLRSTDWSGPLRPDVSLPLIANLLLVGLTGVYVYLTHVLLKSQTDACVVLYVKRRGILAYFAIENIGKGLARDITFKTSEKLMAVPAELACAADASLDEMRDGPLVRGIPALAPGQKRIVLWGPLHVLSAWLGDRTITVTCAFSNSGQPAKPLECPVELHSLRFTGEEYTDSGRDLNEIVADVARRAVLD